MPLLDQEKQQLRDEMRARRKSVYAERVAAVAALAKNFFEFAADVNGLNVAGYWAVGSEISLEPILNRLCAQGIVCALPVVVERAAPLQFRRWQPGQKLGLGPLGTRQPSDDAELVTPQLVLTPLLAFDKTGHRLGQGGGFYDRTLDQIDVTAVGMAFAAQQVDHVPHGPSDMQLDVVITEQEILRVR